jgi:cold shock CspA family protein
MTVGTVTVWYDDRGYGFVELDDRRRAFMHITDVLGRPTFGSPDRPRTGDVVELTDVKIGERGYRAVGVRVISHAAAMEDR